MGGGGIGNLFVCVDHASQGKLGIVKAANLTHPTGHFGSDLAGNLTSKKLNFPIGWSKNQHLRGCGVFSDPKCQWVLHMTKPQMYSTDKKNMNDFSSLGS